MKILLGMSGGVDSTFAAHKLLLEGHSVEGAVLKMHEYTELSAARSAAENAGITLHEIDATEAFDNIIKENFVTEYSKARTPNPCIRCNQHVKFTSLLSLADGLSIDYIATGHYARVRYDDQLDRWQLLRGEDRSKDQSYVLYPLSQEILSRLLLPLGGYEKSKVREIVAERGLHNAHKPDSQDICFVPDGDYYRFLRDYTGFLLRKYIPRAYPALKGFEKFAAIPTVVLSNSMIAPFYSPEALEAFAGMLRALSEAVD